MEQNEFTIVTDFFDIGRGEDKNPILSRTKERYFEEFSYWARIQNKLIVYTDSVSAVRVRQIRESFGRLEQTVVIEMDDLFEQEPELLERMIKAASSETFQNFRYLPDAFSNNPKYDYLWMMKYWFMNDAMKRGLLGENVAWVDFGFDHGGRTFTDPTDFDFLWKYDISDKINLFCLYSPDTITGMESLQLLDDCVMACMCFLPRHLVPQLWQLVRNAMEALLMLECVDDDQQLLLMSYKAKPELFDMHISTWSMPMKEFGGAHLKTKPVTPVVQKQTKPWVKKLKNTVRPLFWWKKDLKRDFAKRCYERAEKFYG